MNGPQQAIATNPHHAINASVLLVSEQALMAGKRMQQNELNPECQADTGPNNPGDAQTQVFALKTTEPRQKSFVSKMGGKLRIGLYE